MYEKYNANNESLFKKGFALYITPIFLAILFFINFKCCFHDMFSSNRMPRNYIDDCLFITWLLIKSYGNTSGKSFFLQVLWKIDFFLIFKESVLEINHSLIFCNSLFTVKKNVSLCLKQVCIVCKYYGV